MTTRQAVGIGIIFVALGLAFQPNDASTKAQCYTDASGRTVCLPPRVVQLPRVLPRVVVPAVVPQVVQATSEQPELRVGGTDTDGAVIVSIGPAMTVASMPMIRQGMVSYPVGSVGASRVQYVRGTPLMWRGPVRRLLCRLWGR